ncbi:Uncharacterized protein APZ42_022317 [Daphnia magna]|uniref:Uncharacterized protein n=1 Tax=Daphnia magna TaxID=35525 RepID=A0A164VE61_9CRUS|nr:Uncharacterized protein APZ42_022317 [Daphnia magna]
MEFLWACQLSSQLFHFAWLRTEDGCLNVLWQKFMSKKHRITFIKVLKEEHGLALLTRFHSVSLIHPFCTKGLRDVPEVLWWPQNHSVIKECYCCSVS